VLALADDLQGGRETSTEMRDLLAQSRQLASEAYVLLRRKRPIEAADLFECSRSLRAEASSLMTRGPLQDSPELIDE